MLRLEMAEPAQAGGGVCWRELLAVRPAYVENEIELLRRSSDPFGGVAGSLATQRRERQLIADWLALGECRSDRRDKAPRMTFGRLRSVLRTRDEHLAHLLRAGLAGSAARVLIVALGECAPEVEEWRGEFFPRPE